MLVVVAGQLDFVLGRLLGLLHAEGADPVTTLESKSNVIRGELAGAPLALGLHWQLVQVEFLSPAQLVYGLHTALTLILDGHDVDKIEEEILDPFESVELVPVRELPDLLTEQGMSDS